jgi:hypothetical protein
MRHGEDAASIRRASTIGAGAHGWRRRPFRPHTRVMVGKKENRGGRLSCGPTWQRDREGVVGGGRAGAVGGPKGSAGWLAGVVQRT